MITLCTYFTDDMSRSALLLADSAQDKGIERVVMYGPDALGSDFQMICSEILSKPRGAGYWIWKPYIILRTMTEMEDGDLLMYSDAGVLINHHTDYLLSSMDQELLLFGSLNKHRMWIKQECRAHIRGAYIQEMEQCQASVIMLRVGEFTRRFITEWLTWCMVPGMIDDNYQPDLQQPDFIEHRHDQAILTEMAVKYEIKLHWWCTQYSKYRPAHYHDNFPSPFFTHHRKRNNEYI